MNKMTTEEIKKFIEKIESLAFPRKVEIWFDSYDDDIVVNCQIENDYLQMGPYNFIELMWHLEKRVKFLEEMEKEKLEKAIWED